jgi:hypothetical protein
MSVVCLSKLVVLANLPTGGLSKLSCIFRFAYSPYVVLIGFALVTRPSLVLKDRLNILLKSKFGDRVQVIERAK